MAKTITKQQILDLVKDKTFKTEDEFRDYLAPQLAKLFKVKESQVEIESITTSFDHTLSNRADIIIRTDGNSFKKAFIVFELKLSKSLEQFKNGDYTEADKQLKKYCQDVRAPYGVLLTEDFCAIYRNKYFSYDQEPKRVEENKLPSIKKIEDLMAKEAILDAWLHNKSGKYILLITLFLFVLWIIIESVKIIFGLNLISTSIFSFLSGIIIALISVIVFLIRKTFD
jgi:hypothetical protein